MVNRVRRSLLNRLLLVNRGHPAVEFVFVVECVDILDHLHKFRVSLRDLSVLTMRYPPIRSFETFDNLQPSRLE